MRTSSSRCPPSNLAPRPEDLLHLAALHGILGALNDPSAGVNDLKVYCAKLPSLAARIVAAAELNRPGRTDIDIGYALAVVGNRGLEEVLLGYLEDLTILKTDLEEQRVRNVARSPQVRFESTRPSNRPRSESPRR